MLITFHSKTVAEVLMLSHHAAPLLRAAGKSIDGGVPERGVFTVEQLPGAIAGIEAEIKTETDTHQEPEAYPEGDEAPVPPMAQHVPLQQRAFPLLDMMRRSLADGKEVTWEASKGW